MKALGPTLILSAFLLGAAVPSAWADIEVRTTEVAISDVTFESPTLAVLSVEDKAQMDEQLLAEIERQNELSANSF
jgi:hypothetical protein